MVARNQTCCCLHIKTCASIIAFISIISEMFSFCFGFVNFLWWITPLSVMFIVFYILVIIGVCTERSTLLIPAEILLGVKMVFSFIFSITLIICGKRIPQKVIEKYTNVVKFDEIQKFVHHFFLTFAITVLIFSCFTFYSFMVIRKARKWLTANAKTLTHPTTENIEIIIYQQQHPTHFHGTFIDPTIQQHHIYYANPAFEGNFNHASMLPSGYEDDIPRDNFQQTAMSQSQLQRLYNGTSSASSSTTTPTPSQYPTNTIRYPTLPSAPPHSP